MTCKLPRMFLTSKHCGNVHRSQIGNIYLYRICYEWQNKQQHAAFFLRTVLPRPLGCFWKRRKMEGCKGKCGEKGRWEWKGGTKKEMGKRGKEDILQSLETNRRLCLQMCTEARCTNSFCAFDFTTRQSTIELDASQRRSGRRQKSWSVHRQIFHVQRTVLRHNVDTNKDAY